MNFDQNTLDMQFRQSDYGLSARRLWEHTELGQVNVFGLAISARPELNDAAAFIDIIRFDGDAFMLTGLMQKTPQPLFALSHVILTCVHVGRPCATSINSSCHQHMRTMCSTFRSYSAPFRGYCGA